MGTELSVVALDAPFSVSCSPARGGGPHVRSTLVAMNAPSTPPERKPPDFKAKASEFARQLLSLFPAGTLILAVLASFVAAAPALSRLCLDLRSAGEPWRPLTGHLAHGSWMHFLSNLLVFVPVSILRERRVGTLRLFFEFSFLAILVAGGVRALHPGWTSYCGLSGITYGFLAALLLDECRAAPDARRGAPLALVFLALCVKSALELSAGGWILSSDALKDALGVAYLPGSHCAGILGGICLRRLSPPLPVKREAELTLAPATAGETP
jgi:rhomboid family GlyGly-CTERM serine protease